MSKIADGFKGASGFFFKNLYKGVAWAGSFLISAIPMLATLGIVYGVLIAVAPPLAGAVTIEAIVGAFLMSTAGVPALIAIPFVGWAVKKLLEDVITPWNDGWYMKLINGAELKKDRPWWSLELDPATGTKFEKGQEYNNVGQKGLEFGHTVAESVMALPGAFVNAVKSLATLPGRAVANVRAAFAGSKVVAAEEEKQSSEVAPEETLNPVSKIEELVAAKTGSPILSALERTRTLSESLAESLEAEENRLLQQLGGDLRRDGDSNHNSRASTPSLGLH